MIRKCAVWYSHLLGFIPPGTVRSLRSPLKIGVQLVFISRAVRTMLLRTRLSSSQNNLTSAVFRLGSEVNPATCSMIPVQKMMSALAQYNKLRLHVLTYSIFPFCRALVRRIDALKHGFEISVACALRTLYRSLGKVQGFLPIFVPVRPRCTRRVDVNRLAMCDKRKR
jgi:hypothetical protein